MFDSLNAISLSWADGIFSSVVQPPVGIVFFWHWQGCISPGWTSARSRFLAHSTDSDDRGLYNLSAQNSVQQEDSRTEPAEQQRIRNPLHTDTFLPIDQQKAVVANIFASLPRQSPSLVVLRIVHLRYAHRACFLSGCRGVTRKMPFTFCRIMPYSFSAL